MHSFPNILHFSHWSDKQKMPPQTHIIGQVSAAVLCWSWCSDKHSIIWKIIFILHRVGCLIWESQVSTLTNIIYDLSCDLKLYWSLQSGHDTAYVLFLMFLPMKGSRYHHHLYCCYQHGFYLTRDDTCSEPLSVMFTHFYFVRWWTLMKYYCKYPSNS